MVCLIGSRCTCFGSASCDVPLTSIDSSALAVRRASRVSCPGREMWIGSVPWPYSTAGTLWARRIRRAAPLPNSVRNSAVSFTSGTNELLELPGLCMWLQAQRGATRSDDLVDHGLRPSPRQPLNPSRHPQWLPAGIRTFPEPARVLGECPESVPSFDSVMTITPERSAAVSIGDRFWTSRLSKTAGSASGARPTAPCGSTSAPATSRWTGLCSAGRTPQRTTRSEAPTTMCGSFLLFAGPGDSRKLPHLCFGCLALAAEEARHRAVLEDLTDGARDQRGNGQHGQRRRSGARAEWAACWSR